MLTCHLTRGESMSVVDGECGRATALSQVHRQKVSITDVLCSPLRVRIVSVEINLYPLLQRCNIRKTEYIRRPAATSYNQ